MLVRSVWSSTSVLLLAVGILAGTPTIGALGAFVMAIGWGSLLWGRASLSRLNYERRLPENRAFPGDTLGCEMSVTNAKWLPVPSLEVEERFPRAAAPVDARLEPSHIPDIGITRKTTALAWHERIAWRYTLKCHARGYYTLGPARLRSGDLLGLFPEERQEHDVINLIVYPQTVELPNVPVPARRPTGESPGGQRIFEDPMRFLGLRDYRPGDSLRRIDWKATARRGALQSRVYEPSATLGLLVALNITTLPNQWEGYIPEFLERGVTVTASLALKAYEARYSVGLLANGSFPNSDQPIRVPIGRSQQLNRVLEALAMVSPFTIARLEDLLAKENHRLAVGTTIAVVASQLSDSLAATLTRLREEGKAVSVLWVGDALPATELRGVPIHDLRSVSVDWAHGGQ